LGRAGVQVDVDHHKIRLICRPNPLELALGGWNQSIVMSERVGEFFVSASNLLGSRKG